MKYTSKKFHLHYIPQYKLLVKSDFLIDTLVVVDEANEIQVLYSYPANEPDADAMKLLGLPFQQVYVGLPLQSLVFIPTDTYEEDDAALYRSFLVDERADRTHNYKIPNLGITASYQYDLLLYNRWHTIFPNAHFLSDFQLVLGRVQAHIPLQGEVLGLHFRDTQVELFVFKNGLFQLYNIFEVETIDDLFYFMLNTCRTLHLEPRLQKILVSGIAQNHAYVDALRRFSDHIEFVKAKTVFHSEEKDVVAEMETLNLLADFPICVS